LTVSALGFPLVVVAVRPANVLIEHNLKRKLCGFLGGEKPSAGRNEADIMVNGEAL
jgi:hypothetical protein